MAFGPGPSPDTCSTETTFSHHCRSFRPSAMYSHTLSTGHSITTVCSIVVSCDIARAVSRPADPGCRMSAVYGQPLLPDGSQRKLIPSSVKYGLGLPPIWAGSTETAPAGRELSGGPSIPSVPAVGPLD